MTEPTKTEQNKLIDRIRLQTTLVEGEMQEGDWTSAAGYYEGLVLSIQDLEKMIGAGESAAALT